jgi:murein DD-endopeptidase MepM/ murein hydrolase activator NlpD
MTSGFGGRVDPFNGRLAIHTGVDFRGDYGATVRATAAGKVTIAGPMGGYGKMVEIDHGNGLSTRYAHLSAIAVQEGQTIESGAVIGAIGSTGRSTSPHLHYETRIDGEPIDPLRFLRAGEKLAAGGAD